MRQELCHIILSYTKFSFDMASSGGSLRQNLAMVLARRSVAFGCASVGGLFLYRQDYLCESSLLPAVCRWTARPSCGPCSGHSLVSLDDGSLLRYGGTFDGGDPKSGRLFVRGPSGEWVEAFPSFEPAKDVLESDSEGDKVRAARVTAARR